MSTAIVILRANRDEEERPVQYNGVETVQPFGAQAVAIQTADGTLILPWGRIKEVILPTPKTTEEVEEVEEKSELIMPDDKEAAEAEVVE